MNFINLQEIYSVRLIKNFLSILKQIFATNETGYSCWYKAKLYDNFFFLHACFLNKYKKIEFMITENNLQEL